MLQTFRYSDDRYCPMNRKLMPSGLLFDPLPAFQIHIERSENPVGKTEVPTDNSYNGHGTLIPRHFASTRVCHI